MEHTLLSERTAVPALTHNTSQSMLIKSHIKAVPKPYHVITVKFNKLNAPDIQAFY